MGDRDQDQLLMMAGIKSGGENYDTNMDTLAEATIQGLGGGPVQPWWPTWLRIRSLGHPEWLRPTDE